MKFMDRLPTVISCCFCCFLRAGTVMIGLFSLFVGLIFVSNVDHRNFITIVDMDPLLSFYTAVTENFIQTTLGVLSIMLCIVSVMLIIGSCCNLPMLIEVYQWGACIYALLVSLLLLALAFMCLFVHTDCYTVGGFICGLVVCCIGLTAYFVIVANSLRLSLIYLTATNQLVT